jgi:hypothetical protein
MTISRLPRYDGIDDHQDVILNAGISTFINGYGSSCVWDIKHTEPLANACRTDNILNFGCNIDHFRSAFRFNCANHIISPLHKKSSAKMQSFFCKMGKPIIVF